MRLKIHPFVVMLGLSLTPLARAEGEAKSEAKEGEAKGEAKPEAKAENKDEAKEGEGKLPAVTSEADSLEATTNYVNKWIPMPAFAATELLGAQSQGTVEPRKGRAQVVLFLASWCEPCQQLMADYLRVQKKYQHLNTDFVFIFSHDTKDDAEGFMKEYGITNGYLASHEVLKLFHNPDLPAIYVADRHGWMATRLLKAGTKDVATLEELLRPITAY